MPRTLVRFGILFAAALAAAAPVPNPKEHFGFMPGDDYKLADYKQIAGWFQKLEQATDRVRLVEFGRTSNGKPMFAAIISDAANLRELDKYKAINRRLALGEASPEEARQLANEGKAIVWIDSGLHATEVAPAQHAPLLAWRLVTEETEEAQRVRKNVILVQVPVINPDGLDMVAEWYRRNVGTPHETAGLPWLYAKYAGHDNNRDWFMMNLPETRHVTRMLFREWFPEIVYNQHQTAPFPARIFIPPYAEPLNPNIPAAVMEGIGEIGAAMRERFARENKPGAISYTSFDAWWNGGLRSVPAFHNMHGILTETAGYYYATPREYKPSELPERFPNGVLAREPSVFYSRPWLGGRWALRDAVEYMLTADFAILDAAATRPAQYLYKAWQMARGQMEAGAKGKPYAYVVPLNQPDRWSAVEMVRRLQMAGIEVRRARQAFGNHAADSYVLLASQPFRGYLVDLMEPQRYPELRGQTGPTKRPYDITGWTLPMQMGVRVERIDDPVSAELEVVGEVKPLEPVLDHRDNSSFLAMAALLEKGKKVRWAADGAILTETSVAFGKAAWEIRKPRVAVYEPWGGNMDSGWTQWLLDAFKVPYTVVRNEDMRLPDLRQRFDAIILASQSVASILHGVRYGESASGRENEIKFLQRPEYTGGIGLEGLARLERFVAEGGTLMTFGDATDLPVQNFPLPVRSVPRAGESGFYSPGSLLRVSVDNTSPVAFGMPAEAVALSDGASGFDVTLLPEFNKGDRKTTTVVKYAKENLLASGWVSGERAVLGKSILVEARHGKGKVILYGFRPQFRGQPFGTFKLVLNPLYLASAKALEPR
ncbi:MAG TPA: M14 metallopeptidase family protein [Bryobacteraceae bacterium]|nr:M14 metallopeptidase family protein [Bryobacteraceae bacterium]